jgi:small subunit ribosomal protein S16
MSVKIRLQRHGKKGKPFYWIVAADARVKRDGKLLEKLGTYNPNTNPATVNLDIDGTVKWLQNGAQPTDTARAILSYKGALLKNHLAGGVRKGALTEDQAEEKYNAWLEEKAGKVANKTDGLAKAEADAKAKALAAEKEVNEARKAVAVEEVAPVEEVAETPKEENVEAVVEEAAPVKEVVETPKEETVEAVVEEAAPTKEVTDTPKEETVKAVAEEAAPVKEVAEIPKEETVEAAADSEVSNEEE